MNKEIFDAKELIKECIREVEFENMINMIDTKFISGFIKQRVIKDGKQVGVFVAFSREKIGFSFCSTKDKFNKDYGLKLAIYRAQIKQNPWEVVPMSYKRELVEFLDRIKRYYKNT